MKKAILMLLAAVAMAGCRKDATYFTVTFDANGGTLEGVAKIAVKEGERIKDYAYPTRQDYYMKGWFNEPEATTEWKYDNAVVKDITLYAGWERLYTVVWHANGGSFPYDISPETYSERRTKGEKLYLFQNVSKPGAVLEGWYRDPELTQKWDFATDTVDKDTDLYARWGDGLQGLTRENYPRVDGATSTRSLNVLIACKLLGLKYFNGWFDDVNELCVMPDGESPAADGSFLDGRIKTSQSHGAMTNLIDKKVDIILRSTTASPDERAYAEAAQVTLIETPIALDAFVMMKGLSVDVESLTLQQIRDIYTKKTTRWPSGQPIKPFARPRNSGSEEAFRELVMGDVEPAEFPEEQTVFTMAGLMWEMDRTPGAIGYIFKNYKDHIVRRPQTPVFALDGVMPDAASLRARTYPLTTEVYAIIRADLDPASTARQLYDWLLSDAAQIVLQESGFTTL